MLVLCYGLTKSGSTLAFELIKGMLESAGHPQTRLPDGPVNPGHRVNYVQPLNRKRLRELLSAVDDRLIAVKTHTGLADPLFFYVAKLQAQRELQLVVSYRDPRDICLSMLDAGNMARAAGNKEFSEITDLATAANRLFDQLEKFYKWAAVPGALLLPYDTVAFDTDSALDRLEECLGLQADRIRAKGHAFQDAFTQKNKGRRTRFLDEMSSEQSEAMAIKFAPFLSNFIHGSPDEWLAKTRSEIADRETLRLESRSQRSR